MSTLLVDELYDGITFPNNFRINNSMQLRHMRCHIYKQGTIVDGELVLEIYQGAELLKEAVIDYTEINTQIPATYAHGMIRFDFEPLQLNHDREDTYTEYNIKLFMRNHTTDTNNFVGTVRGYERKFYDTYGTGVIAGEAPNDFVEPLDFELFEQGY